MLLGVNIDHIAVLREARAINDPSVLDAVPICKIAGASQITIHLREDRRHIQDLDVKQIIETSFLPINLEASINKDIIDIIIDLKPHRVTLVPEKREEVTTEGGLNLIKYFNEIQDAIKKLKEDGIEISLFIYPLLRDNSLICGYPLWSVDNKTIVKLNAVESNLSIWVLSAVILGRSLTLDFEFYILSSCLESYICK
jgi:pyridoxine 5-phosphate synthase